MSNIDKEFAGNAFFVPGADFVAVVEGAEQGVRAAPDVLSQLAAGSEVHLTNAEATRLLGKVMSMSMELAAIRDGQAEATPESGDTNAPEGMSDSGIRPGVDAATIFSAVDYYLRATSEHTVDMDEVSIIEATHALAKQRMDKLMDPAMQRGNVLEFTDEQSDVVTQALSLRIRTLAEKFAGTSTVDDLNDDGKVLLGQANAAYDVLLGMKGEREQEFTSLLDLYSDPAWCRANIRLLPTLQNTTDVERVKAEPVFEPEEVSIEPIRPEPARALSGLRLASAVAAIVTSMTSSRFRRG